MQAACKSTDCDIFLDEATHMEASNLITTTFHSRIMVKGKSQPLNIYKTMDIYDKITLEK